MRSSVLNAQWSGRGHFFCFLLFPFSSQLITEQTIAYKRGAGVGRGEPVGVGGGVRRGSGVGRGAAVTLGEAVGAAVLNEGAERAAAIELDAASVLEQASVWVSPSPVNWHGLSSSEKERGRSWGTVLSMATS